MLIKTKLAAAAFAALAIGMTAFASASEARTGYYYWGWGWGAPISYASYVVPAGRHGVRVCHLFAEYDGLGFYEGNGVVCSRRH